MYKVLTVISYSRIDAYASLTIIEKMKVARKNSVSAVVVFHNYLVLVLPDGIMYPFNILFQVFFFAYLEYMPVRTHYGTLMSVCFFVPISPFFIHLFDPN